MCQVGSNDVMGTEALIVVIKSCQMTGIKN